MSTVKIIPRPNMRKYGTIYEVEVGGVRLCRKDGAPRRFGSADAASKAGHKQMAVKLT
jgi:ribosomal protein L23